jgi:hypothetical protein
MFGQFERKKGYKLENEDVDHAEFGTVLREALLLEDAGTSLPHDIADFDHFPLAEWCKIALRGAQDICSRIIADWKSDMEKLQARIEAGCPEYKAEVEFLAETPAVPLVESLILNPMCKHLSPLCAGLEDMLEALKPMNGGHILDKDVTQACGAITPKGTELISVTFVLFHVRRVFPKEKGPKQLDASARAVRQQLIGKGTWGLLQQVAPEYRGQVPPSTGWSNVIPKWWYYMQHLQCQLRA